MTQDAFIEYLKEDCFIDFQHPSIRSYAEGVVGDEDDQRQIAIKLYRAVRDDIQYNPYTFETSKSSFSASYCLAQGRSYCIPKACLLAATCRIYGIPSRLGFADVRNHLASPQFLDYLQTDVFVMHGYVELYLNGKWVKATPAFDQNLCQLMGVSCLEFDGENDSVFHAFDQQGERHMEYLREHGTFSTIPHALILESVATAYPHLTPEIISTRRANSYQKDLSS